MDPRGDIADPAKASANKNATNATTAEEEARLDEDKLQSRDPLSGPGAFFAFGKTSGEDSITNCDVTSTPADAQGVLSGNDDYEYGDLREETYNEAGNLAQAVPIEEAPEMPAAVEFDPDSKPIEAKRFPILFLSTFCCILFAAVGGAVFLTVRTQMSSELTRQQSIRNAVVAADPHDRLDQSSEHFRNALEWITDTDPFQLASDHSGLMQRFILAHFHFSTSTERPWRTCTADSEDLSCLGKGIWMTGTNECDWYGIECDVEGQVLKIACVAYGLTGTIPDTMALLPELWALVLPDNELEGPIPHTVPSSLRVLSLHNNSLTGTIPNSLTELPLLKVLSLNHNRITGSLPSQMTSMTSLLSLFVKDNDLVGTLPPSLFQLPHLVALAVGQNDLVGTLPTELGHLTALTLLEMGSNHFSGTIPSELLELRGMDYLELARNKLSGSLPPGLFRQFSSLTVLDVKDNELTGMVLTDAIVLPEMLDTVELSGNAFTGSLPDVFCRPPRQMEDWLILKTDCKPDKTGVVEFECSCCTQCCDSNGNNCVANFL